jgi:hypothetical protein
LAFAIKVKTKKAIESVNRPLELALILLVVSRDPGAARSLRAQEFECEHCYRGNLEAARSLTAREFESRHCYRGNLEAARPLKAQ